MLQIAFIDQAIHYLAVDRVIQAGIGNDNIVQLAFMPVIAAQGAQYGARADQLLLRGDIVVKAGIEVV